MNGTATITSKAGWKWDDILYDLGMRLCDIAHQDMVVLALTTEDIRRAKANGQIAFVASLEAATMIENEVDRLDILYGFGIRSSGIAYSEANSLGCGLREARDGGLTDLGRQAVRRMNQLGIAIDISHSGDQTSLDTIEVSEKPIFITHVGFGPDTLYGDHVGLHNHFAKQLSIKHLHAQTDFPRVEYVAGIENPTEAFPNIVRWLVKHGYSDDDIAKVIGGNAMRVLDKVWWR
jgi:microsomal dipeptidase-like Zn-dependent dipeptidase